MRSESFSIFKPIGYFFKQFPKFFHFNYENSILILTKLSFYAFQIKNANIVKEFYSFYIHPLFTENKSILTA